MRMRVASYASIMRNYLFYEWGLRTKLKGTDKEWAVKKIKSKRVDVGWGQCRI